MTKYDCTFCKKNKSNQSENSFWVTPLIQTKTLEKKGGALELLMFTGAYEEKKFPSYFKTFRSRIREHKIHEVIVISLHSSSHVVPIIYDPFADTWEIFDINQMPEQLEELKNFILPGEIDISSKVKDCFFSEDDHIILKTRILTTKDAAYLVKPAIQAWWEDLDHLHDITFRKMNFLDHQQSWLSLAAKAGDHSAFLALLVSKADVYLTPYKNNINHPFYLATSFGHFSIVKRLLSQPGIALDKGRGKMNTTPLIAAAVYGHKEIIEMLLEKKADPNVRQMDGGTALLGAIQFGHEEVVKLLFKIKNIDMGPTHEGFTPLILAVKKNNIEMVNLIIKEKSMEMDPNEQTSKGIAALTAASMLGYSKIVNILLTATFKTKINVNIQSENMMSPIYWAVFNGHAEMVQSLIKAGAEFNIISDGRSLACLAAYKGYANVLTVLAQANRDLLNLPDAYGQTPAYFAAETGCLSVVKILVELKADLDTPDKRGWSPLMRSAQKGYTRLVEILIKNGANVNQSNLIQQTSLHHALNYARNLSKEKKLMMPNPSYEIIRLLIISGARLDIKDAMGNEPINYADDVVKQWVQSILKEMRPSHLWPRLFSPGYEGGENRVEIEEQNRRCKMKCV